MLSAMLGYSQKDIRARGALKTQGEGLSSGAALVGRAELSSVFFRFRLAYAHTQFL